MSYLEIIRDHRPVITGIRDGLSPAWFSKEIRDNNVNLKKLIYKEDLPKYMAGVIPDYEISLDWIDLEPSAKLTDFIHIGGLLRGFVINEKVRDILQGFHMPEHTYYPVIFHQKDIKTQEIKKIYDYWWLYFNLETGEHTVDFSQSTFDEQYHKQYYPDCNLTVNSFYDYEAIIMQTSTAMLAKKLVFNSGFDKDLDIWGTRFLANRNYISVRLNKAFEKGMINGYRTRKPDCELIFY